MLAPPSDPVDRLSKETSETYLHAPAVTRRRALSVERRVRRNGKRGPSTPSRPQPPGARRDAGPRAFGSCGRAGHHSIIRLCHSAVQPVVMIGTRDRRFCSYLARCWRAVPSRGLRTVCAYFWYEVSSLKTTGPRYPRTEGGGQRDGTGVGGCRTGRESG